jgi:hypothetical protein
VKKVVSVLARVQKRRIEDEHRETRNARCRLVRPYIKKLPKRGSAIRRGVQPLLQDFYNFSTVKEKWIDPVSGTDIDDDAWNEHLPQVEVDLANFREEQRVLAIRRIIAAKEDTPIGRLCNLSATYPPRRYPPSFFAKLTSHDIFSIGHGEVKLVPYPVSHHWRKSLSGQFVRRPRRIGVNRRTVITIRALLRAAGLESKTATIEDLEDVQRGGRSFVWRNDPVEGERTVCRTWDKLVGFSSSPYRRFLTKAYAHRYTGFCPTARGRQFAFLPSASSTQTAPASQSLRKEQHPSSTVPRLSIACASLESQYPSFTFAILFILQYQVLVPRSSPTCFLYSLTRIEIEMRPSERRLSSGILEFCLRIFNCFSQNRRALMVGFRNGTGGRKVKR